MKSNHILTIVLLSALLALSTADAQSDLGDGLHAYWPLDGDMLDQAHDHHLTTRVGVESLTTTPRVEIDGTSFGSALNFDGKTQWAESEIGDNVDLLSFEDGFTLSVWFKIESFDFWDTLISSGGANHWELRLLGPPLLERCDTCLGGFSFTINSPTGVPDVPIQRWIQPIQVRVEASPLHADTWHHLIVRGSPGAVINLFPPLEKTLELFHNGELLGKTIFTTFPADSPGLIDHHFGLENFVPPNQLKLGVLPFGDKGLLNGYLDDVAIWSRSLRDEEIDHLVSANAPLSALLGDQDQDGLLDAWERNTGLNLSQDDSAADPDGDGLTNLEEATLGTLPMIADSDDDGLADNVETASGIWESIEDTGTNPRVADSDGDGLLDGRENPTLSFIKDTEPGSDPNKKDTDGDGYGDGLEFADGTDPTGDDTVHPLRRGLISYWPLDNDFIDYMGPHNGTARGTKEIKFIGMGSASDTIRAKYGRALVLDGKDQYVQVTDDSAAFDFPGESFSVSAWFNHNGPNGRPTIMGSGGDQPWLLGVQPDGAPFIYFNPGTDQAQSTSVFQSQIASALSNSPLRDGMMTHAVGVYNHETREYRNYINGKLSGQRRTNAGAAARQGPEGLQIGHAPNRPQARAFDGTPVDEGPEGGPFGTHWGGVIDDVAVWNRVLTSEDVDILYGEGRSIGSMIGLTLPSFPETFRHPRITREPNSIRVQWSAKFFQRYEVQYAETLAGPWTLIDAGLSNSDFMSYQDVDTRRLSRSTGFYRIEQR